MSYPYIVSSDRTITVFIDGAAHAVPSDFYNYDKVKAAILNKEDKDTLLKLLAPRNALKSYVGDKAQVIDGVVWYQGKELHNTLSERILQMMQDGFPVDPMLLFLENLEQNVSMRSREELYDFLSHKGLPITEDGHFLAYKAVRPDFMDIYSGKHYNGVGEVLEMPRGDVDDDRSHECSYGFHVGAMDYVQNYGSSDSVLLLVKVNPRDAVSVPRDHSATKLRVCRYEVLSVYHRPRGEVLEKSVYSSAGESLQTFQTFNAVDYASWSWDDVVDEVLSRGLYPTTEDARDAGKQAMVDALHDDDARLFEDDYWSDSGCSEDWEDSGC